MSRGRPVIGTQLGGHTDMLDETTGILVPQGDAAALAAAMSELIEDPERREALGRAAAERAKSFAGDKRAAALRGRLPRHDRRRRARAEMRILIVAPMPPDRDGGGAIPILLQAQLSRPARAKRGDPGHRDRGRAGRSGSGRRLGEAGFDVHVADRRQPRRRRALAAAAAARERVAARHAVAGGLVRRARGSSRSSTGSPRRTSSTSPSSRTARWSGSACRQAPHRC